MHLEIPGLSKGLGDTPTCGADPCGAFDWVWVSDPCLAYLKCASPTDPRVIGFFPSLANELGTTAGQLVGGAAAGAAAGSGISYLPWIIVGVGAVLLFVVVKT